MAIKIPDREYFVIECYEIVGLVRNTKYEDLRESFQPIVFQAQSQDPVAGPGDSYLIRSQLPMDSLISAVRSTFTIAAPNMRCEFEVFQTSIRDTLVRGEIVAMALRESGLLLGAGLLVAAVRVQTADFSVLQIHYISAVCSLRRFTLRRVGGH